MFAKACHILDLGCKQSFGVGELVGGEFPISIPL